MGKIYDSIWGRAFAAYYDRGFKASETDGLERMRRELLRGAQGRVVELGAGTGTNLKLYPESVEDLVLVEPDTYMARRLRANLARDGRDARVVEARAERLPFEDSTFDTVVATLVFCTIGDPHRALEEAARILRPSGRLLFIEHVRSDDQRLAQWQDRFEKPLRFLADGCHCNRDTLSMLRRSRFDLDDVERAMLPRSPSILTPLIMGSGVLAS